MADLAQNICASIYSALCYFCATPLLLYYLLRYHQLYKLGKMNVRRKHFIIVCLMELAILSIITINRPFEIFDELYHVHNEEHRIFDGISRALFVISLYTILSTLVLRCWILFYDTRLNQWRESRAWKKAINGEEVKKDWFRAHKNTCGSSLRVGLFLGLCAFIFAVSHYALYLFLRTHERYYQISVGSVYATCILLIFIKLPSNRDLFRLRDELKFSLYICAVIVLVFVINAACLNNEMWQFNLFEELVYLCCCTGIGLLSTMFAMRASSLNKGTTRKMGTPIQLNNAFSNSKLKNNLQFVQSPESDRNSISGGFDLSSMKSVKSSSPSPRLSSAESKFNFVLSQEAEFEMFMLHIKAEFSLENMLALIEFCQYEEYISEKMDKRQSFLRKYNVQFYENIPQSKIVKIKTNDVWQKYVALFNKYIKPHSKYELNLSYQTRNANIKLYNDIIHQDTGANLHRLLGCIEDIQLSVRDLLFDTFSRFDGTVDMSTKRPSLTDNDS